MKKNEAAAEFSCNKTIGQQRSLPAYTVREDLLQVRKGGGKGGIGGGGACRCTRSGRICCR